MATGQRSNSPAKRKRKTARELRQEREQKFFDKYAAMVIGKPTPKNPLRLLYRAALRHDNPGRAARMFLFWLDGEIPPDGPSESGASDLLDMTDKQKEAVLEVLKWWMTHGRKVDSLLIVMNNIRRQFNLKPGP